MQNIQAKSFSVEGSRKDAFISGQVFAGGAGDALDGLAEEGMGSHKL